MKIKVRKKNMINKYTLINSDTKYIAEYEADTARIRVRLSDRTDITREQVFDGIARVMYNLALYEHKRNVERSSINKK